MANLPSPCHHHQSITDRNCKEKRPARKTETFRKEKENCSSIRREVKKWKRSKGRAQLPPMPRRRRDCSAVAAPSPHHASITIEPSGSDQVLHCLKTCPSHQITTASPSLSQAQRRHHPAAIIITASLPSIPCSAIPST